MITLPEQMNACVLLAPRQLGVQKRSLPVLDADQVLVEVSTVGVCGSDVHSGTTGLSARGSSKNHSFSGTSPQAASSPSEQMCRATGLAGGCRSNHSEDCSTSAGRSSPTPPTIDTGLT